MRTSVVVLTFLWWWLPYAVQSEARESKDLSVPSQRYGGKPCKRLRLKNGVTFPLPHRHRSGGEVVSYLCHHGYHLAGYPSSVYYVDAYCLGNGSWSRALPNCTEDVCESLENMTVANGNLAFFPDKRRHNLPRMHGSVVVTCHRGFYADILTRERTRHVQCIREQGGWTTIPKCTRRPCELPALLDDINTDVLHVFPLLVGTVLEVRCRRGFAFDTGRGRPARNGTVECLADSTWSAGRCKRVTCPSLAEGIAHASLRYLPSIGRHNVAGERGFVVVTCDAGYTAASNQTTARCLDLVGTWSSMLTCIGTAGGNTRSANTISMTLIAMICVIALAVIVAVAAVLSWMNRQRGSLPPSEPGEDRPGSPQSPAPVHCGCETLASTDPNDQELALGDPMYSYRRRHVARRTSSVSLQPSLESIPEWPVEVMCPHTGQDNRVV